MEKPCRKCAPNASPTPFFNLVGNPKQPLHAGILLQIRYFEGGLSKKNL